MNRKLKMGMVGGGRGAFIGAVHRMAANLDGKIELVAGCFSSDPEKSRLSGEDFFLNPSRVYSSYQEMAQKEAALPEGERIDFVSIVVQNNMHFAVAKTFIEAGFHVICDKPMTFTVDEAVELRQIIKNSGQIFALTHNYTGYPMVKEAREWIKDGKLGQLLKVVVEYPQGYATESINGEEGKIANWRADPQVAGVSNCMGDIGTHAHNLVSYITGLEVEAMCAELTVFIPGRQLDDDGNVLVRYKGGVKGILYASQVSAGEENNLTIRVFGTQASLEWKQEHPNELAMKFANAPRKIYRRGNDYVGDTANRFTRIPFGHPEAFIEAFANIYLEVARAITDRIKGVDAGDYDFPNEDVGLDGMLFVDTVVKSSQSDQKWYPYPSM